MSWFGRLWGSLFRRRRGGMQLLARQQDLLPRRAWEFVDVVPDEPADPDEAAPPELPPDVPADAAEGTESGHALREYLAAELRRSQRQETGASARDREMGRLLRELEGEVDSATAGTPPQTDDELYTRAVQSALSRGKVEIPMMPRVAIMLQKAASDPRSTFGHLASIIESDPAVAAEVLRVANSPFYRSLVASKSVRSAVAKMGLSGTRDVVLMVTFRGRVLKAHRALQQEARALWEHATGCGYLGRLIAHELRLDPDVAFTSGLFHDVGKLVLLDVAVALSREQRRDVTPSRRALAQVFQEHHVEAGALVAERWNLTADVIAIIHDHHRPPAGLPHEPYVRLITACDAMVTEGLSRGFGDLEAMRRAVRFAGLSLTDEQITRLCISFFEDFEETRAMLG